MSSWRSQLYPCIALFGLFTALTGLGYPLLMTALARALFPRQAEGSLVESKGEVVGSELIAQSFELPERFWARPSATTPNAYDAANSCGSNLGPTNPDLARAVEERVQRLRDAEAAARQARKLPPDAARTNAPVPIDLVTASGSGLDPEISPEAAEYQVPRVALARGKSEVEVRAAVARHTYGRAWGVLGEPRVRVLELNLDLDGAK